MLPAYANRATSLSPSFVLADEPQHPGTVSGNGGHTNTARLSRDSSHPRGPRSGLGSSVPIHHHLIDPIRPTRGHVQTSPLCDLYRTPSLCGERLGDPRVVPNFRLLLLTNMSLSETPEVQWLHASSSFTIDASLRVALKCSASSRIPQIRFTWGNISGLPDSLPLQPARLLASRRI